MAVLAGAQHGVVARTQLLEAGLSGHTIRGLLVNSHLHLLHRGVYAVGHTKLSVRGHWMAAVLACGPGAVLSHRAAAGLHDIRPIPSGLIDVTATVRRQHPGIRSHQGTPATTTIDGIPVTTLEHTLLDLAATAKPRQLQAALEQAQRQERLNLRRLQPLLAQRHGHRGVAALRQALEQLAPEAPATRSWLERRFLQLVRAYGLPPPQTNVYVDGFLVDFFWPEADLVVEVDSYDYHRPRRSFDEDRRRDTIHTLHGRRTLRVTDTRLTGDANALMSDVSALLAAVAPAGR